jgi:RND family efflux transporter MFP subunit
VTDLKNDLASLRIDRDQPARRSWRWGLLLFLPGILGLLALYLLRARQSLGAVEVQTVQAAVVGPGQARTGTAILNASGYVVARRKAVVSAKIQGRLAQLRVEEGTRVREGEVIARLESSEHAAQVQRAKAQLQRAQAELEESRRQLRLAEGLARDKVLASDQLEAAQSKVKMGEASLSQAQAELAMAVAAFENTLIKAPFTGTVVKKMAEVGESVAPIPPGVNLSTSSGAIVALADLDTLEVEADVAEANVTKLHQDQPAEVTVEAFAGKTYRAVLRQVIPTADRTKATVQVKVTILDKDSDLKPEMSSKVTFVEAEKPVTSVAAPEVSVPTEAVARRQGASVVFEVRDGRALQRAVVTGGERQGRVVVREGLSGSETLVARPPDALKDGDAVRIRG